MSTSDMKELAKKILELVDPLDWYQINCSSVTENIDQPSARYFLSHVSGSQYELLIVATAFTVFVMILAFIHWYYVWNYISEEKRQNKLYFLISLFPVSTFCCFVAMASPRTSLLMSSLGVFYFLMCLFVLISLIRHLFGTRQSFSTTLLFDHRSIDFRSPPFCCLCPCLPKAKSTVQNLRHLERMVLQAPVVRAIIVVFNVIALAEWREAANKYIHFSEMVSVASLLLAIFGVHTLARLTSDKLSHYGFMTIFRVVDVALLLFTAQQPIIFDNILIRFGVFHCGPLLNAQDNARFLCNFVIITEMLLLSLFTTVSLSPRRSALFDMYGRKEERIESRLTEESLLSIVDQNQTRDTLIKP